MKSFTGVQGDEEGIDDPFAKSFMEEAPILCFPAAAVLPDLPLNLDVRNKKNHGRDNFLYFCLM